MKKRLIKVLAVALTLVIAATCFAIPASAAVARTRTYYVFQELTYGELQLANQYLSTATFCENTLAGRIAASRFYFYDNGDLMYGELGYDDYNSNNYSYDKESLHTGIHLELLGNGYYKQAQSYHKIKLPNGVTWVSEKCEGDNNGWDIPKIVLN